MPATPNSQRPPASFLPPKWRKLIFASGAADRRLYETAVLATLRDRLKGSNIWITGSRDYRAFEDYLLPAEASQNVSIGGESTLIALVAFYTTTNVVIEKVHPFRSAAVR